MELLNLLKALDKYNIQGDVGIDIKSIRDDSRKINRGDLFVAITGIKFDGYDFIPEAIKKGAKVIVSERQPRKEWLKKVTYIKVKNSRKALGILASSFFENPSNKLKVIGVTGTKGKTTTVHLIHHILNSLGKKAGLVSSITYPGLHVTTPGSIEINRLLKDMVDKELKYAVIEVSSHGIDQGRIEGIKFDVGVLTNVAPEHLDYHKTFSQYKKVKMSFINSTRVKVICPKSTNINVLPGKFNNLNAEAAILALEALGFERKKAISTLYSYKLPEGRLEEIKNKKGIKIYIDFAHTPDSLRKVLAYLKTKTKRRLIVVFGCAGERDVTKREKMGIISTKYADISIFTAEDPRSENVSRIIDRIVVGAKKAEAEEIKLKNSDDLNRRSERHLFFRILERGVAISYAIQKIAQKGDIVVICGKGHEKSMAYKDIEYPWSDYEAVEEALKGGVKKIMRIIELKHIHFTGIKGVGMTALSLCSKNLEIKVTGSDTDEVFVTDETLKKADIDWTVGFGSKNLIPKPDLVITTGAHGGLENPEVLEAKRDGLNVITYAEALAAFANTKQLISVCGVGGKGTTSSILAVVLDSAGVKPSFAIGMGDIYPLETSGRYDKNGKYFICEADEYAISPGINNKPKFSLLNPFITVVTNIEHDHPDIYPSLKDTLKTFHTYFLKIPRDGLLIANIDNKNTAKLVKKIPVPFQTYGFNQNADWFADDISYINHKTRFQIKNVIGESYQVTLNVPGKYNILNSLAAFIAAKHIGISEEEIIKGLEVYKGARRRFEKMGEKDGALFYDDYAHHPNEIKAVLKATREWFPKRRIVAIFQPHTYSRTRVLLREFAQSFTNADCVAIMDIYASAREKNDGSVSSKILSKKIKQFNKEVFYTRNHKQTLQWIEKNKNSNDIFLTIGAGDIFHLYKHIELFRE